MHCFNPTKQQRDKETDGRSRYRKSRKHDPVLLTTRKLDAAVTNGRCELIVPHRVLEFVSRELVRDDSPGIRRVVVSSGRDSSHTSTVLTLSRGPANPHNVALSRRS